MSSSVSARPQVDAHRLQTGALRLTRRGRLVVFLACLVVACVASLVVAGGATGSGEAGEPMPTRQVTVHPGETLWGIAAEVTADRDPREIIEEIRQLNDIGASLQAGDKIDVPVGD